MDRAENRPDESYRSISAGDIFWIVVMGALTFIWYYMQGGRC